MKLLIVDPNISLSSPSMKGVVRALPQLRAAGFEIELWCWECDEEIKDARIVRLPRLGRMHTIGAYAFAFWVAMRRLWIHGVKRLPRPDVTYTVAWYLPDCDVCHVHFSPWDWNARQRMLGVSSLRDAFERTTGRIAQWYAERFLRRTKACRLISVSAAVADDLRRAAPSLAPAIRVLPNSYDAARFHPGVRSQWRELKRAALGFAHDAKVFIFVSTGHYRRKGFFLAVEALAQLRRSHPEARFLVVGGNESRLDELRSQLEQTHAGWREWITFTGNVTDVEKCLAASDALFFPSYSEAFALVEVEAAACGLPLFLTQHHGSEMILEDGVNGRYLEFDAARIAGVLAEFCDGRWSPSRLHVSQALDTNAYGERLVGHLIDAARARETSARESGACASIVEVKS